MVAIENTVTAAAAAAATAGHGAAVAENGADRCLLSAAAAVTAEAA